MQFPPPDTRISYDLLAVAASAKTSLFYLITSRIISLSDKDLLYNIWHILLKIPLCNACLCSGTNFHYNKTSFPIILSEPKTTEFRK